MPDRNDDGAIRSPVATPRDWSKTKDIVGLVKEVVTIGAILVTGFWVQRVFSLTRQKELAEMHLADATRKLQAQAIDASLTAKVIGSVNSKKVVQVDVRLTDLASYPVSFDWKKIWFSMIKIADVTPDGARIYDGSSRFLTIQWFERGLIAGPDPTGPIDMARGQSLKQTVLKPGVPFVQTAIQTVDRPGLYMVQFAWFEGAEANASGLTNHSADAVASAQTFLVVD